MAIKAVINDETKPTPRRVKSCGVKETPDFSKSYPVATAMVGIAKRKENSTASALLNPTDKPPIMDAAARETPGMNENDWKIPMRKSLCKGSWAMLKDGVLFASGLSSKRRMMPPMNRLMIVTEILFRR